MERTESDAGRPSQSDFGNRTLDTNVDVIDEDWFEAVADLSEALPVTGLSMTLSRAEQIGTGFEKSALAFRTIGEVASELDVAHHVLRFWESRFTQVRPLKRGGGRRYYRPEDVDLLRRIRSLLYEDGHTIKGVQRMLKEGRGHPSARNTGDLNGIAEVRAAHRPSDASLPRSASKLDDGQRLEVENVLNDLEEALRLLRGAMGR